MALLIGAVLQLALALSAGSPVDGLWRRDLHEAVRGIADTRGREEVPVELIEDLVRLAECEPLPPLAADAPDAVWRRLVRLEAARGARLGERARSSATVWRDLLNPDFFTRRPRLGDGALLLWPEEGELWPDEELRFTLKDGCQKPPTSTTTEQALLDAALFDALRADPENVEVVQRLAYHRALLQYRAGDRTAATQTASELDPERIRPALAGPALLLRLELGLESPQRWAELIPDPGFAARRLAIADRLVAYLSSVKVWGALLRFTTPQLEPALAAFSDKAQAVEARDLICRHLGGLLGTRKYDDAAKLSVRALKLLGGDLRDADAGADCLRAVGLELAAARPLDELTEPLVLFSGPPEQAGARWADVAARALGRDDLTLAKLASGKAGTVTDSKVYYRALATGAEVALASGDLAGFETTAAVLISSTGRESSRTRQDREQAALILGQSLLTRLNGAGLPPQAKAKIASTLHSFRDTALRRNTELADALLAAAENRSRDRAHADPVAVVSVGEIEVAFAPGSVPAPALTFELPEPFSLLAVPAPDGTLHPWFYEPPAVSPVVPNGVTNAVP